MSIVRKTIKDLPNLNKKRLSEIDAINQETIDYSDIPDLGDNENFWKKAVLHQPGTKTRITLRLDDDVLTWLKSQGKGYQTRINAILRTYYEAHRNE